jgi:hypothetical protein
MIHRICLSIQQNLLILQRTFGIYYISPYYHHARALSHDGNSVSDSLIPCAVMRFPCRTPQWVSVHGTRFTERRTWTYASCKFRPLKARIVCFTRGWTFWTDPGDGGTIIFWSRDSSPNYTEDVNLQQVMFEYLISSTSYMSSLKLWFVLSMPHWLCVYSLCT